MPSDCRATRRCEPSSTARAFIAVPCVPATFTIKKLHVFFGHATKVGHVAKFAIDMTNETNNNYANMLFRIYRIGICQRP